MNDQERVGHLWAGLNECHSLNRDITIKTVTHWLDFHGAGFPDVPLMQERIRDDAKLWAVSATQAELEVYAAAAIMQLEGSAIPARAAKRLAAMAWRNMGAEDRAKFREWIDT